MTTTIPVRSTPAHSFTIVLEGQTVAMSFRYETLIDGWIMTIERGDEVLVAGRRCVMGTDLLRAFNLGLGAIILFAVEDPGREPGRDDWDSRVKMLHFTEAERVAILP